MNDMVNALQAGAGDGKSPGHTRDVQWLRANIDNEEAVLEFLDNPTNMLED